MKWAMGLIATSIFYIVVGTVSSKFHLNMKQMAVLQACLLPIVLALNIWYFWSMELASNRNVPLLVVVIVAVISETMLGLLSGWLVLHQKMELVQWVGVAIALIGVFLMNMDQKS